MMRGVRLQYFYLVIRKCALHMKRRLLRTGAALLVLSLLLGVSFAMIRDNREQSIIQVALVIPEQQTELSSLAKLLQHMESVRGILGFVYPRQDEIEALFESDEIQAAIIFAEDFYQDVNSGVNTPICIQIDGRAQGINLFQELLSDMVVLVDMTEAASYAMIDVYCRQDAAMSMDNMEELILNDNVELLLQAREKISLQIVSPTGEVGLVQYYVAIFFFLFLMLTGCGFWNLYTAPERLVEAKLSVYGVNWLYRSFCKIGIMSLTLFFHALIGVGICEIVCDRTGVYIAGFDGYMLLLLLWFSFLLSCFYHGILLLGSERGERKTLFMLVIGIFLVAGGCVVPCAYLPNWLADVTKWTPFYLFRSYLEAVLFGGEIPYTGVFAWAIFFLICGIAYDAGMSMERTESSLHDVAKRQFRRALYCGTEKEKGTRIWLYLKWQWKRRSPVIVWFCGAVFILLCGSIRLPQWENREVYVSGREEICREMESDPQFNRVFHFVYEEEAQVGRQEAESGQILASIEFDNEEIRINTNAVSPEVLIMQETAAVAYYRYAQRELLREECGKVFGTEAVYDDVYAMFEQYMHNDALFRIEYKMK